MASGISWEIVQFNQAQLSGQVTDDSGNGVDLTGLTLSLVIKESPNALDSSGTTYAPTIVNAATGTWSMNIAGTAFAEGGALWYRLDVVDGSQNHLTANYGNITVIPA